MQPGIQSEVEQLQLEIQNTVAMYKRACEELVHAQNKVRVHNADKNIMLDVLSFSDKNLKA